MSAHLLDNAFAQRKPQPGTLYKTVHFHKAVENSFLIFNGNTDTCIFYEHFKLLPGVDPIADSDGASMRKLNRIAHKVGNHLIQISAVGTEPGIECESSSICSSTPSGTLFLIFCTIMAQN